MEKLVENFLKERGLLTETAVERDSFEVDGIPFELVKQETSMGDKNTFVKRIKSEDDENVYHIAFMQKRSYEDDDEEGQYRFLFDGVYTSYPPVWEARGTPENLAKLCLKYDEQGPR